MAKGACGWAVVPDEVFEQHVAVLGKTGAGKSYAMRGLAERLLEAGRRVCVVDPKGDWWGLRAPGSAAPGARGYRVVIFGGERGDVPLAPGSGGAVAELVASGDRPAVVDVSGLGPGERTRFFTAFAAGLFKHNRQPLSLFVDEVHNFAFQGRVADPDAGLMLHWANRLASEGRGRGLRLVMASQRPQKVHKDTLTCAETLVAMRVVHPLDRKAIAEWVDGVGDPEAARGVLSSLAQLEVGEAWVWAPGRFLDRVRFGAIRSYDSMSLGSVPVGDEPLPGWEGVDLGEVRERLAGAVAEAEANDPKALRRRVAELEAAKAGGGEREQLRLLREQNGRLEAERDVLRGEVAASRRRLSRLQAVCAGVRAALNEAAVSDGDDDLPLPSLPATRPYLSDPKVCGRSDAKATSNPFPERASDPVVASGSPDGRILGSLAWWLAMGEEAPKRVQVAFVAGYTENGHFNNRLGALRSSGLVKYPSGGRVSLTEAGAAKAPVIGAAELGSGGAVGAVRDVLSGVPLRLFEALLAAGGECERSVLASRAGYTENGHFNNNLGRLRSLGLVEYPRGGRVRLADWVR